MTQGLGETGFQKKIRDNCPGVNSKKAGLTSNPFNLGESSPKQVKTC